MKWTSGIKGQGELVAYYFNGQVREKSFWVNGQKHGKTIIYYETGQKWAELDYEHGKKVHIKSWHENGRKNLIFDLNTRYYKEWNIDGNLIKGKTDEIEK